MSLISNWKQQPPWVKGLTASVPVLAGVLAIITNTEAAVNAWDRAGLPTMATRGWVRDSTRDGTFRLNEIQIDIARAKRDQNLSARNKLEIDMLKMDDESRVKSQQEIRRLDETIAALNEQIRAISGSRGPQ